LTRKPGNTPKVGTYKLVVRDMSDQTVFTKDFTFKGPKLEIMDSNLEWEAKTRATDPSIKSYCLRFKLTVNNTGDLPVFISGGVKSYIDRSTNYRTTLINGHGIEPNEIYVIEPTIPKYVVGIPRDGKNHTLTLIFEDLDKNVILTTDIKTPK